MPQFAFTVTDTNGQRTSGTMVAEDQDAAMKILSERELVVTRLLPIMSLGEEVRGRLGLKGPRLGGEQLMVFTQQLAAMLDAGLTVKNSVDVMLKDTTDPEMRHVLLDVSSGLGSGGSLTELLVRHPRIFSDQYVAMVAAGESGGKLPTVLTRLASLIERTEELKRKVRGALYYPALVMVFAILLVAALFIFGIPRFREIYQGLGGELPWATQAFIAIGTFLAQTWIWLSAAAAVAGVAFARFVATPSGRRFRDRALLAMPIVGPLSQRLAISRFARTLSTLHSSGVPLVQSLELVAASMGNVVMASVVKDSMQTVLDGEPIVEPLRRSGLFTEMSVSMLAAGEHSGTLDRMLDKVADYYESQVEVTLRGLTSLLEPAVMIAVGAVVGAIIVAMILPIFRMATLLFT